MISLVLQTGIVSFFIVHLRGAFWPSKSTWSLKQLFKWVGEINCSFLHGKRYNKTWLSQKYFSFSFSEHHIKTPNYVCGRSFYTSEPFIWLWGVTKQRVVIIVLDIKKISSNRLGFRLYFSLSRLRICTKTVCVLCFCLTEGRKSISQN
jgi:hypothetical protein